MGRITPTLHPKSRFTSSLFATTLFASFFVVVLPHVLPCPAPRVAYTDDGTCPPGKRRKRKVIVEEGTTPETAMKAEAISTSQPAVKQLHNSFDGLDVEGENGGKRSQRECPIPKPGGLVREILGFKKVGTGGGTIDGTAPSSTISSMARSRIANDKGDKPP